MRHNILITHLFGGSSANEGLGLLSMSFDWTMLCKWLLESLVRF
jgi:hypothetical protein